jgi:hypothetical protein
MFHWTTASRQQVSLLGFITGNPRVGFSHTIPVTCKTVPVHTQVSYGVTITHQGLKNRGLLSKHRTCVHLEFIQYVDNPLRVEQPTGYP